MNRIILLLFILTTVFQVQAKKNYGIDRMDRDQLRMIEERKERQQKMEQEEQRMQEAPSSTAIGGSRSGQLETEKDQDAQKQHDIEKQKRLYEHEGYYRRGL